MAVMKQFMRYALTVFVAMSALAGAAAAADRYITLASTTSTENSGLLEHIVPIFTAETGIDVRVVALGTGQALRLARAGDADVLLVHHRPSEEEFVAEGFGVARHEVMYNDFVLVGPRSDPAAISGAVNVREALTSIASSRAMFASRGDDSGTHKTELGLWKDAGLDPIASTGDWYRELGSGMGATLVTAVALDAYTLSDRATWTSFANKADHGILLEGDPALFNQYAVILIDPRRHPHVKADDGQRFVDWMLSPVGQAAIGEFRVDGKQLFFPNAAASTGD